ncbi:XRE family transcriptional regulator [Clostridioides difficile]|uniref:helix-turn-helix domain-containing protein n=1 Tax=Clostridioides difficile TaxID=1496 RepID=UPI001C1836F1|nr:helix-turn-helix transcriptional regulator [Clostridioides difficile]MDB2711187.1 XRE family transcriptional regulator [Clostridioides difficile]HBF4976906.1 helix-turn-helix transcriptional regulator [Clostridioides difficile]HBF5094606.1 helix-turn-helix transcriptional regulator [Clostridioides difficile]HBH3631425.1 helix-turn-helix transcriptional regulator [Clostridioides difficile]
MINIKINKIIKEIRENINLSQQKFGEKLGVSKDVISNIEYNRVEPKSLFINYMCDVFNVNKEWLLNGVGNMYISAEEDILLGEVFYKIASSKDEILKELVINISKLDAIYIASLNEIVKRSI